MKKLISTVIVAGGLLCGLSAHATVTPGQTSSDSWMNEYSETRAPIGYAQFCEIHPGDCIDRRTEPARVNLTPERWRELVEINDHVNVSVEPVTDEELYGVAEYWNYPLDGRGDCEDYVLLKRRILMDAGWPAASLLITVVRDEQGEGHAVLTATTSAGDLILDNQHAEIRLWHDTPYGFLRRQSMRNPHTWVSLRQDGNRPSMPVAGTRSN